MLRGRLDLPPGTSVAPYVVAVLIEMILAVAILVPRSRRAAAWVTTWGFIGAASVTALAIIVAPASSCRCLGSPSASLFQNLVLQGVVIFLGAGIGTRERIQG
jgi:uncharacterized membrane protein